MSDERQVSIGSKGAGYPCPKDGAILMLVEDLGAWCPECHTVWRTVDEVSLADLDASDETGSPE